MGAEIRCGNSELVGRRECYLMAELVERFDPPKDLNKVDEWVGTYFFSAEAIKKADETIPTDVEDAIAQGFITLGLHSDDDRFMLVRGYITEWAAKGKDAYGSY